MFSLLNVSFSHKCFHTALSDYLKELDARVLETHSANEKKKHVPQRKSRVTGSVIDTVPPPGYPKWTVGKEWLKGLKVCLKVCSISQVPECESLSLSFSLLSLSPSLPPSLPPSLSLPPPPPPPQLILAL